jgi:carbon monoxide dehydrogenase subunit G
MPTVTATTHIAAPVSEVFALFTDLEGLPSRIKAITKIEKLTTGPVDVGTRFRETRIMFKKEATEEMEFTAFEPNRSYTLTANSCGCLYTSVHRFEPDANGTRVTVDFTAKAQSFMAKLFTPVSYLMKGMLRKCLQGDLDAMKTAAEATAKAV